MTHSRDFMKNIIKLSDVLDHERIENICDDLDKLRKKNGRLFILGVGGSAANASHAVNDFRKLCGIEAYSPSDNVSELTARTNDEGWETVFSEWLKVSKINKNDALMIFSVGGGNFEKNVSKNLILAVDLANEIGANIYGIIGKNGGYVKKHGTSVVVIPTIDEGLITPLAESFQGIVWHCIVSNPKIQINSTKW